MGQRRRGNRTKIKSSRCNESLKGRSDLHTTISIPRNNTSVPEGSDLWDTVSLDDLRDIIRKYGHHGLRFPARVVASLLDEIERLREGQA